MNRALGTDPMLDASAPSSEGVTNAGAGPTRALADWVAGLRPEALPDVVAHQCKRMLVDYLAAVIPGSTTGLTAIVRTELARAGGVPEATVVLGPKLPAAAAAFINGTAAHGLEVDDGYTPGSVHPGAATLPAVLAAAERDDSRPERLLSAIAVAVEVTARVAAAGHPATWRAGFHNTSIAGVIGAAAGVAHLRAASADQVADAFGLAASHAGGLWEFKFAGSDVKRIHAGKSARDGLVCADLALAGVTGPHTVLEGPKGYYAVLARGEWSQSVLLDGLGTTWVCLDTYVKPYPCCRHLHGPIDAALAIAADDDIRLDDVVGIDVQTYAIAASHDATRVKSVLEAQLSIPHAVASTLALGQPGFEAFEPAAYTDATIRRLAGLTRVVTDAACEAAYPRSRPAQVTIHQRDGRLLRRHVDDPLGEPSNPIDDAGLDEKFLRLTGPALGRITSEQVLRAAWNLDGLETITRALARADG